MSAIRDTPAGQFLRLIGLKSWLYYPEEVTGFELPSFPWVSEETLPPTVDGVTEKDIEKSLPSISIRLATPPDELSSAVSQKALAEPIIVSFSEDDMDNPRNWSTSKKAWTVTIINVYTFVVYATASIITPTAGAIVQKYDVSIVVASLSLSMYVVGCKSSRLPDTLGNHR
jgi:DHA1 family multidrug resistance protein-like MFS transporter